MPLAGRYPLRREHRPYVVERLPFLLRKRFQVDGLDVMSEVLQKPRGIFGAACTRGIQVRGNRGFEKQSDAQTLRRSP